MGDYKHHICVHVYWYSMFRKRGVASFDFNLKWWLPLVAGWPWTGLPTSLQLGVIGRAVHIHWPMKCCLSCFILNKQTTSIPKRNKEKYQRVDLIFSLSFLWVLEDMAFQLGIRMYTMYLVCAIISLFHSTVEQSGLWQYARPFLSLSLY